MSITFLAIAASLLTAGNPQPAKPSTSAVPISTSQVQPLAAPTPDSWQAAITPHHATPCHTSARGTCQLTGTKSGSESQNFTGKTEPLFKVSLVKNIVTVCCTN